MSNFKAVATVTAALKTKLQTIANEVESGATVNTGRPDSGDAGSRAPLINIFLYNVEVNSTWRNVDLPTRDSSGRLVTKPQIALDLHYLLTFYGEDSLPHLLLGRTVSALHAEPILLPKTIQNAIKQDNKLQNSDLERQVERVRVSPVSLNFEDISKLWSVFGGGVSYDLSLAYCASAVLIAADVASRQALPVGEGVVKERQPDGTVNRVDRGGGVKNSLSGSMPPQIDRVDPQVVTYSDTDSPPTVLVEGSGFGRSNVMVSIGDSQFKLENEAIISGQKLNILLPRPVPAEESDDELTPITAGIKPLYIQQPNELGQMVRSNAAALVVRPQIMLVQESIAPSVDEDEPAKTQLSITLLPFVQPKQNVRLMLNRLPQPGDEANEQSDDNVLEAVTIDYVVPDEKPSDTLRITLNMPGNATLRPGLYLVRIQIDGADSPLTVENGRYARPSIQITGRTT